MKIGDRVKLLENVYNCEDDGLMLPGTKGYINNIELGTYIYVQLDEPVDGVGLWLFYEDELEVV